MTLEIYDVSYMELNLSYVSVLQLALYKRFWKPTSQINLPVDFILFFQRREPFLPYSGWHKKLQSYLGPRARKALAGKIVRQSISKANNFWRVEKIEEVIVHIVLINYNLDISHEIIFITEWQILNSTKRVSELWNLIALNFSGKNAWKVVVFNLNLLSQCLT